jgi:hypothetical protein
MLNQTESVAVHSKIAHQLKNNLLVICGTLLLLWPVCRGLCLCHLLLLC